MTQFGQKFLTRRWLLAAATTAVALILLPAQGRCAGQESQANQIVDVKIERLGGGIAPRTPCDEQSLLASLRERTVTMNLNNVSLRNGIKMLGDDLANINIKIDEGMIQETGICMDQPVNLCASDVALNSFLIELLKPVGLTYVVVDDSVLITTQECAHCRQAASAAKPSANSCALAATVLKPLSHAFSIVLAIAEPKYGQSVAQPATACCPQGVCTGTATAPCCPIQCPAPTKSECGATGCCPACKDCCPLCYDCCPLCTTSCPLCTGCPLQALVKPLSNITFVIDERSTKADETSVDRKWSVSITNVDFKAVLELVREIATVTGAGEQRVSHPPVVVTNPQCFKFITGTSIFTHGCTEPQAQTKPCPTNCPAVPMGIVKPTSCPTDAEALPMPRQNGGDVEARTNLERQNEELRQLCTEQQRAMFEMQAMMREFSREVTALRRDLLLVRLNQATHFQQPLYDNISPEQNPWSPGPANTHFVPGAALWGSPMVPVSVYPR